MDERVSELHDDHMYPFSENFNTTLDVPVLSPSRGLSRASMEAGDRKYDFSWISSSRVPQRRWYKVTIADVLLVSPPHVRNAGTSRIGRRQSPPPRNIHERTPDTFLKLSFPNSPAPRIRYGFHLHGGERMRPGARSRSRSSTPTAFAHRRLPGQDGENRSASQPQQRRRPGP